jgi:predicted metal-dependent peptidase
MHHSTLEEKITRAKTRLVVKHPYFGLLASRLATEASDEVEAFLSDGKVLQYNPDYFADADVETIEFALANSVMHHVLAHENRQKGRQGWLWQLATDYAINDMLGRNGFAIPPRVHYDDRFSGCYAEEIYAQLKDEIKNEEYNDDEENDEGYNEQNKNRTKEQENPQQKSDDTLPLPPQELEPEVEEAWARAMKEAMDRAMEQGNEPGGMDRLFTVSDDRQIDWRSELYHAINRHLKSDYTFAKPNKKMIAHGVYLPRTESEKLTLAVAIDSSGSVDEALLGHFVGELEALLLSFPDVEVDLLICDVKIQGVYRFTSGEILDFPVKGGGGTDFRPIFEHIETSLPDTALLLVFTDAEGRFPDTEPHYETIWIVPEAKAVPFGRTILLSPHVV